METPAALRLRGRAVEIAVLGEALDRVASGRPAIVLIEGEPGIGKSRLLAASAADARGRGMQVATGRAEELDQARPFGVAAAVFGCRPSSRIRGAPPSPRCWPPRAAAARDRSR